VSPSLTQSSKQPPSIFTFDLFDTLITRNVLRPEDIFKKVGRRLRAAALWPHSEERFSRERIAAGTRTLRRLRVEEITLTQIYETLAANAGWSEEQAVQAMALEIAEELAAMRPIAEMRDRFNALDTASKAIVSDTYYSQSTIKQMLERCGIECPPDRVFLSSTLDKRKSTGRLFPYVAQQLDTATGDILHTGDNEHSDLKSAQSQGFAAERYIGSLPNRYESILRAADPDIDTSISGALRIARLAFSKGSEIERTLWDTGTQVAGPILFGYVAWVLETDKTQGIKHLYFLARDGQILLELARRIDPTLPTSYLFASRQAWHLPSIDSAVNEQALSWLADEHALFTLRSVLARVNVRPDEVASALQTHGIDAAAWDKPVGDRTRLIELLTDPALRILIAERAQQARGRLVKYLNAEGVLKVSHIGIVDLGWNGRLQRSLLRVLEIASPDAERRVDGFYLSLKKGSHSETRSIFHAYYDPGLAWDQGLALMMELFCSADHGGLLGFTEDAEGKIHPMFAQGQNEAVLAWGLRTLHAATLAAADHILALGQEKNLSPAEMAKHLKQPALAALNQLVTHPSKHEAEALGRFPFNLHHAEVLEMAPQMSVGNTLATILPASIRAKQRTLWMQGTLVRSLSRFTPLALRVFRLREAAIRRLHRG
jgi:predicted HAD superfamily hydrolase